MTPIWPPPMTLVDRHRRLRADPERGSSPAEPYIVGLGLFLAVVAAIVLIDLLWPGLLPV